MTAKDLIEKLSQVDPDTEIIGGTWNGRTNTYTVLDVFHVFLYDQVYADFFGTPGAFDDKLMTIKSKNVVYLGSLFDSLDKRVMQDRGIIWQMRKVLSQHRSKEWKKERIYQLLTEFDKNDFISERRKK
ncbi:MAG: hypothetical protein J6W30_00710 [Bacteroidales bacterium]|nr:hypothetical protein [Bacteroidales bacterium]